jgi:hypothetical protein
VEVVRAGTQTWSQPAARASRQSERAGASALLMAAAHSSAAAATALFLWPQPLKQKLRASTR